MKFVALKRHLAEDTIEPCYVVTGDDDYIIRRAIEMLRALAGGMPDFNVHRFSQAFKPSDVISACLSLPLLGGRVVVEVANFNADAKEINNYLRSPSPDTVLVFILPSIPKSLSALAKSVCVVECDRLDEGSLTRWVLKRCQENGSQIDESAASRLVNFCERFMSRIETEADKLSFYRLGAKISLKDVEALVTPSAEFKVYELGDAIIAGRNQAALTALKSIINDTSGGYVISSLYSYFRRLLHASICKDGFIAEYLGVKEYAITAAKRQSKTLSPKKLKQIMDKLQDADFDFKNGRITDTLAAQSIIMQALALLPS